MQLQYETRYIKNTAQTTVDACSLLHMHKDIGVANTVEWLVDSTDNLKRTSYEFSTIDNLVVQLQPNLVTVGYVPD